MKKVIFVKNGYVTEMTDKVADIYLKKKKVKLVSEPKAEIKKPASKGGKK